MGSGIAQVSAAAGFPTTVREVSDALGLKARQSIEKSLAKGVERGKVTESERDKTLGNLRFVTDLKERPLPVRQTPREKPLQPS